MVAELREGKRPRDQVLKELRDAEDAKRAKLAERVCRELGEGASSLTINASEIEALMNQATHMLIKRQGGGFFDTTVATSASVEAGSLLIETTGHIEQDLLVKKIDAAFYNASVYRNANVEASQIAGGRKNTLDLIALNFNATRGETLLEKSKAEKSTRNAMRRIDETIGETLIDMTSGVGGIQINPYLIGLEIQPEGLHIQLLRPAGAQQ